MWGGAAKSHSILLIMFCLCPALSLVAFILYLVTPRAGVIISWMLLTGTYISLFLNNLRGCLRSNCTTTNPLSIAWGTLVGMPTIWFLFVAAISLLLDFTTANNVGISRTQHRD